MPKPEQEAKPTHKVYNLSERKRNMPLAVRALLLRDRQARRHVTELKESGVVVEFHRLRSTPNEVRGALHCSDNAYTLITSAFDPPMQGEDTRLPAIRKTLQSSMEFVATTETTLQQTDALAYLNQAVARRGAIHGGIHALFDRPNEEEKKLKIIGGLSVGAAGIATVLELLGIKGTGLLIAQSTDDVGNAALFGYLDQGGKKSTKQVFKDNWPVIPILVGAGIADNTIVPQLLESPNTILKMTGGLLFSLAAVGGSLSAAGLDLYRNYKRRRGDQQEERKRKSLAEAGKQLVSHPFKLFMIGGIAVSGVASEYAATKGIILDHWYSGTLQTFLGQIETITGYGGLLLSKSFVAAALNTKDAFTLAKSHVGELVKKKFKNIKDRKTQ